MAGLPSKFPKLYAKVNQDVDIRQTDKHADRKHQSVGQNCFAILQNRRFVVYCVPIHLTYHIHISCALNLKKSHMQSCHSMVGSLCLDSYLLMSASLRDLRTFSRTTSGPSLFSSSLFSVTTGSFFSVMSSLLQFYIQMTYYSLRTFHIKVYF